MATKNGKKILMGMIAVAGVLLPVGCGAFGDDCEYDEETGDYYCYEDEYESDDDSDYDGFSAFFDLIDLIVDAATDDDNENDDDYYDYYYGNDDSDSDDDSNDYNGYNYEPPGEGEESTSCSEGEELCIENADISKLRSVCRANCSSQEKLDEKDACIKCCNSASISKEAIRKKCEEFHLDCSYAHRDCLYSDQDYRECLHEYDIHGWEERLTVGEHCY